MDELRPWTADEALTITKKYSIDDGKPQILYEAFMKVPKDKWLQDDFVELRWQGRLGY